MSEERATPWLPLVGGLVLGLVAVALFVGSGWNDKEPQRPEPTARRSTKTKNVRRTPAPTRPVPNRATDAATDPLLEAAQDEEALAKARQRLAVVNKRSSDDAYAEIGAVVDRMVIEEALPEETAIEVEVLLQTELEEIWAIKESVRNDGVDYDTARARWSALLEQTDQDLGALLSPQRAQRVRAQIGGK